MRPFPAAILEPLQRYKPYAPAQANRGADEAGESVGEVEHQMRHICGSSSSGKLYRLFTVSLPQFGATNGKAAIRVSLL